MMNKSKQELRGVRGKQGEQGLRGVAKSRVVSTRVDETTFAMLSAFAVSFGVTQSRAVELMLRRHTPITVDELQTEANASRLRPALNDTRAAFTAASLQLQKIGLNVNQLAAVANTARDVESLDEIERVRDQLETISGDMQIVIDILRNKVGD